jgi:hypothetical protein
VCKQCVKIVWILELPVNKGQWFSFRGEYSVFQQAAVVGWNQFILSWCKATRFSSLQKKTVFLYITWLIKSSYKFSNLSVSIKPVDVFTMYKYRILFFSATCCHTALRRSKQDFWYIVTQNITVASPITFWRLSIKQLACEQTQNEWFV